MNYTLDDIKKIQDFQKYARFICDHFDIDVQLDSTKAETDGKVITLPNISNMSDDELDMMYAILLHEAGHIKFSLFDDESFLKLKSQAHAYLANAIEDARIENLLMKEFDGAVEIFEKLYCVHSVNRKLMKTVFNIQGKRPDLFNCLGLYVHSYLIDCKTAPFSRIATRANYIKVKNFIKKYNIESYLDNTPLNTWDDVIVITEYIYNLFIKEFSDKSQKLDFASEIALKKEIEKELAKIQQKIKSSEQEISSLENKVSESLQELNNWELLNQDTLSQLKDEHNYVQEQFYEINTAISKKNAVNAAQSKLNKAEEAVEQSNKKIESITQDIQNIKDKIANGLNGRGKPFTDKQLDNVKKDLAAKENILENTKQKIQNKENNLKDLQNTLKQKKEEVNPKYKNETDENLAEKRKQLSDHLEEAVKKLNEKLDEKKAIENNLYNNEVKLSNKMSSINNEINNSLYKLEDKSIAKNMPVELLPGFESTPGWEDADKAQRDFDKEASAISNQIVRNGQKAGIDNHNIRDLSVYVDNALEKVKNIDLVEIFKNKINTSHLPVLNESNTSMLKNTNIDKSIFTHWETINKHSVLTTEFDITKIETTPKEKNITSTLLKDNISFIQQLKRTFANKLKFAKKDYYRGNKEEGNLDSRSIWKLPTNQGDDYFEINRPKIINKMAASILVDISGSHDKEETEYGKKLQILTLALSEAMKSVHIKHEILGFHAPLNYEMRTANSSYLYNRRSNSLETVVYKNFGQKDNSAISNIVTQCSDNSDGESVRIAIRRLKKENSKSKMLFVISDGKPFLSDADVSILDKDLSVAIKEAQKNKIRVIGLSFNPNGTIFYGNNFCHITNYNDVIKFFNEIIL